MLRRPRLAAVSLRTGVFAAARLGSHGPVHHYDHTASLSRAPSEAEALALAAQSNRTVSGVVPGKLFMRHWLAAQQSTESIYTRGLSLVWTGVIVVAAGVYGGFGLDTQSALMFEALAFFAIFLMAETHWHLMPLFAGIYAVWLLVGI